MPFGLFSEACIALDLADGAFDGIFANASLFHVPVLALPRVLSELFAALKPGGALFSSNPRGANVEGWNGSRYGRYHDLKAWTGFLVDAGFELIATGGTTETLHAASIDCERINKVTEGRPHIVDQIKNDEIDLIINTTEGKQSISDSFSIRREALNHKVTYFTTVAGAQAVAYALSKLEDRNNRKIKIGPVNGTSAR